MQYASFPSDKQSNSGVYSIDEFKLRYQTLYDEIKKGVRIDHIDLRCAATDLPPSTDQIFQR